MLSLNVLLLIVNLLLLLLLKSRVSFKKMDPNFVVQGRALRRGRQSRHLPKVVVVVVCLVGKCVYLAATSHYGRGRGRVRKPKYPEKTPTPSPANRRHIQRVSRAEMNPEILTASVLTTTLPGDSR